MPEVGRGQDAGGQWMPEGIGCRIPTTFGERMPPLPYRWGF